MPNGDKGVPIQGPDGKMYQFPAGTDKAAAITYFKKKGIGAPGLKTDTGTEQPKALPEGTIPGTAFHYGRFQAPAGTQERKIQDSPFTPEAMRKAALMTGEAGGSIAASALTGGSPLWLRMISQFLGGGLGHMVGSAVGTGKPDVSGSVRTGAEFAGAEGLGGVLIKAGETMSPAMLKKFASRAFQGSAETAGKAIDTYLNQPALQGIKVDVATPINDMLDAEIARANRVGATSLGDRLTQLKTDWNKSYNLKNPTLSEANAFKREIAKYTSFAGEANKITLNQLQKRATGIVAGIIDKAAPGVKPLNAAYADIVESQKAIRSGARTATRGKTGMGLSLASSGLRSGGEFISDLLKAGIISSDYFSPPAPVPPKPPGQ